MVVAPAYGTNVEALSRNWRSMFYKTQLNLAGTTFHITVDAPVKPENIDVRFGAYTHQPGQRVWSPSASLHVETVSGWVPPQQPLVEYPGADSKILANKTVHFFRQFDELLWDPGERHGIARRPPYPRRPGPMVDATEIDTPLRLILSHDLPLHGGLLMHGAGYGDERGAVVFLAPTRGGKTTTSRKLPEPHVLSDDQIAVRRVNDTWFAYALPFVGDYAKATVPREVALRAVVLLGKAETISLKRIEPARALASVANCTVRFVRNSDANPLLDLCLSLVTAVPVYRLALSKSDPVMPMVERLLA
jgi:hypothetical protein